MSTSMLYVVIFLFNLYADYIMWDAQTGIKIARSNINNLRYADDISLMAEGIQELKRSW